MRLAELQARFYRLVTARDGLQAALSADPEVGGAVEAMVNADGRLSAAARLGIYADMYLARIRDVLCDEYPKTLAALGAAAFQAVIVDYLDACRPRDPSLREAGARLPTFLATHPGVADRPWIAELARLERTRLELFDGPDAETLTVSALRGRAPERFAALSLRLIPSHALLSGRFDVAALWRADEPGAWSPSPAPSTVLVWRGDLEVLHRAVEDDEATWLRRLGAEDVSFEALCAGLAERRTDAAAATRAFELLGRWASDGLLRAAD